MARSACCGAAVIEIAEEVSRLICFKCDQECLILNEDPELEER